jgi:hypothetical protein
MTKKRRATWCVSRAECFPLATIDAVAGHKKPEIVLFVANETDELVVGAFVKSL